jgi:hypothetical protein
MEKLFKFDYFHIIIDEVTLIRSQGSLLFPCDGIGTLAREQKDQRGRREKRRAHRELPPEEAHRSRMAGGGRHFLRSLHPCHDDHPARTVQAEGEVVN